MKLGSLVSALVLAWAALPTSPTRGEYPLKPEPAVSDPVGFVCPPCGCESDSKTFDAPGECPDCRMGLVRKEPPPPLEKWEAPPPSQESAEVKSLIDRAGQTLRTNGSDISAILSDKIYLSVHAWPRFRELIRTHGRSSKVTIVTPDEPGTRMRVRIRVVARDGSPSAGATIYFYHTSARGGYGANAAHVQANAGDMTHARLFGYAATDADGTIEIETIRPGGYPDSDLPEHIHVNITTRTGETRESEVLFEDDPRLTPSAREQAARERFAICRVARDAQGSAQVFAEIKLD